MKKCKNAIVHACCVLGLSAGLGLAGGNIQTAAAQDEILNTLKAKDNKQPLLMQADQVTYEHHKNRVVAKGNVEIYYNKYSLFADSVIYDRKANTLSAVGNVRIQEPNGSVVNTDQITLTDDFRQGFIQSLKIVTKDDARIAAARARKIDQHTTIFDKGVFTPCKTCKDRKAPLWRIKAGQIIHKQDEKNIYYKDASLEFLGIPIAYIPYFSHPDPTVKRRSGFLFPKVSHSEDLGFSFELPYFYNLAPNKDLTFNPRVYSEQGVLWQGEWRHRTKKGKYNIKLDGIREENPDPNTDSRYRGSIETQGAFKAGENWNWGWNIVAESDDTYRRKYSIDNILTTNRVSDIYAIRQTDKTWFESHLYYFGALTSLDTNNAEAFVHPVIDYNHIFASPIMGGELSFDANLLGLSRRDGDSKNRLVAELKWRRSLVDSLGQVYKPFFELRGDVIQQPDIIEDTPGVTPSENSFETRGQTTVGLTYEYPFIARTKGASHIIAPKVQIVHRSDVDNQSSITNDDARSLVFDDTILFDTNKYSGYDRTETGTRANIGIGYNLQLNSGGHAKAVFGQSIQIDGENTFERGSGLGSSRSDYVAGVYIEPSANFLLLSQARFDEDTFDIKRADIFAKASYGPFSGSINYANIEGSLTESETGIPEDREEIQSAASLQISNYWSLFGSMRYNLVEEEFIQNAVGVQYADECYLLSVSYSESTIEDGDIEPDSKVMVRFEFKHLGGTSVETKIDNNLLASSEEIR